MKIKHKKKEMKETKIFFSQPPFFLDWTFPDGKNKIIFGIFFSFSFQYAKQHFASCCLYFNIFKILKNIFLTFFFLYFKINRLNIFFFFFFLNRLQEDNFMFFVSSQTIFGNQIHSSKDFGHSIFFSFSNSHEEIFFLIF